MGQSQKKRKVQPLPEDSDEDVDSQLDIPPVPPNFPHAAAAADLQECSVSGVSTEVARNSAPQKRFESSVQRSSISRSHMHEESQSERYQGVEAVLKEDYGKQVLRLLQIIRLTQQEHGEVLQELTRQRLNYDVSGSSPLVPFPFPSSEALEEFNSSLNEDLETQLVQELAQLGGNDVRSTTRKILEYLLTDSAASEFSWLGQKGKKKFGLLKLPQIIVRGVRANRKHSAATKDDVESTIKSWLRHAKDRLNSKAAAGRTDNT
ncbi:uncharacterized protein LOC135374291 isoform X2 [Ornithodoros turicata]|uniref:uncharacterized protein LOC135374291 isoform X2 n=1 Tax=Ornithodoros turicata TaxID=34597 RepID=UPI003138FA4C